MEFWIQLLFMALGGMVPILFRALHHAGSKFDLRFFFVDNQFRFLVDYALILIAQVIIYFQPGFLESLRTYGLVVPVMASSAIGFGISWFAVKTIPTKD